MAELREAIASTVGDVSGVETCTMFITKTLGGKRYVAGDPRVRNVRRIRSMVWDESREERCMADRSRWWLQKVNGHPRGEW